MSPLYPGERGGLEIPQPNADASCGFSGWGVSAEPIHYDCKDCKTKVVEHLLAVYKRTKTKPKPPEQPRLPIMDEWRDEE